nr:DNA mismatch repair protein MutS [Eubacteriales bacterium]
MPKLTPMMQQYLSLKEKYSDCLLFFRLGDFYEMFFEDAITGSREMELTLTGRDCGLPERAPMCGVPYHSVSTYITKLIDKGYKVAICEQLTDPALAQGLVERDVIRVITPGTVIEETMLNERTNNYIASVFSKNGTFGLAYCDVSTGDFFVMSIESDNASADLFNELDRICPREIIANPALFSDAALIQLIKNKFYTEQFDERYFDLSSAAERLMRHFEVATLSGYGMRDKGIDVCAAGALMCYLEDTQKNALSHISKITKVRRSEYMVLDSATRRNLELTEPLRFDGSRKGTLLYVLDKTKTSMGSRLLRKWIDCPLQLEESINLRLNAVESIVNSVKDRETLAGVLSGTYDIERLCSRIAYGSVTPRDCRALCSSMQQFPSIKSCAGSFGAERTNAIAHALDLMEDIFALLSSAIADEPPVGVRDGGIIRAGYNEEVDSLRDLAEHGSDWIKRFEANERERTGIKNLRVGYNRVFGYYIEVTKSMVGSVPLEYQRKQTIANAERYVTPELKETEEKLIGAKERCIALEYELFCHIREVLLSCIDRLKSNAMLIAELDAYLSLALTAVSNNYVRPKINNKGKISIVDGRHPVVENGLKDGFVSNSTDMNNGNDRIIILTGPNMAGKSTYMRQVALITLMAHIGSFVPAKSANISIVDRIFTRVGASDSLSTGQSTFMVEMSEMANILNNATARSLLIIDEIGRGTSTFDGLSIAWAVLEYISDMAKCGAKTLFATHYHELTELEGKLDGVKNYRIMVKEYGDNIIFLRKIVRGGADKSFGIQVAKLAGLPNALVERAKAILAEIEASDINNAASRVSDETGPEQISLLGDGESEFGAQDIIDELIRLDANKMTPLEALGKLYELSSRAKLSK